MRPPPSPRAVFVRELVQSAKRERPRLGARARALSRLTQTVGGVAGQRAGIVARDVGSVFVAAALAVALCVNLRASPEGRSVAATTSVDVECPVSETATSRTTVSSSGSSSGSSFGSSSG